MVAFSGDLLMIFKW